MSNPRERLAAEVRAAIGRSGLHQSEVAARAGMSPRALRNKAWGITNVSVEDIGKIARATGANPGAMVNAAFGIEKESAA